MFSDKPVYYGKPCRERVELEPGGDAIFPQPGGGGIRVRHDPNGGIQIHHKGPEIGCPLAVRPRS